MGRSGLSQIYVIIRFERAHRPVKVGKAHLTLASKITPSSVSRLKYHLLTRSHLPILPGPSTHTSLNSCLPEQQSTKMTLLHVHVESGNAAGLLSPTLSQRVGRSSSLSALGHPIMSNTPSLSPGGLRPSRHVLPQLVIPAASSVSAGSSQDRTPLAEARLVSPETPSSTARSPISPNSAVIDLTDEVRTLEGSPVTSGGFSDIYRGLWVKDGRTVNGRVQHTKVVVAIKLLRTLAIRDLDGGKAQRRLNREVYVWHRLDHPNIVQLFGTSYHMNGRPAMVMQWYDNGSADDYLRDAEVHGKDINKLELVYDVAKGLKYLHDFPIVHGDLKINNVLITDEGRAVLSDFGLSQMVIDLSERPVGLTPTNPSCAPVRWSAPELVEDDACPPGLATDVWSFGCIVYNILTGNSPYHLRVRDGSVVRDIHARIKPCGGDPTFLGASFLNTSLMDMEHLLKFDCWSFSPSDRSTIANITTRIASICDAYTF